MTYTFLHAADLHLDSPLWGLSAYPGAPVDAIRGATRRALENLVQAALDRRVAFVLLAGDVYDGDCQDFNTPLFFCRQMSRLRAAGIPVFLISGNHDAASRMTPLLRLRLPDGVRLFSADEPETVRLDEIGVAVHGQSFACQAVLDNLARRYPTPIPGFFNIGLLHTSASGCQGHEPYAPCSLDDLRAKGFDYWALGHVHCRQELLSQPAVAFSGNVQGRHIRETGPKGCLLVTVDGSRATTSEFCPLDVLRWEHLRTGTDAARDEEEVLDQLATQFDGLLAEEAIPRALRITLTGRTALQARLAARPERLAAQIQAVAADRSDGTLWIEKVDVRRADTAPSTSAALDGSPDEELLAFLTEARGDDHTLLRLGRSLDDLRRKLPFELQAGADGVDPEDIDWLRELLEEVEPLLVGRLRGGEEDA